MKKKKRQILKLFNSSKRTSFQVKSFNSISCETRTFLQHINNNISTVSKSAVGSDPTETRNPHLTHLKLLS